MINFNCSKLQSFSVDNPAIDINYKAKIIKTVVIFHCFRKGKIKCYFKIDFIQNSNICMSPSLNSHKIRYSRTNYYDLIG